MQLRRWMTGQNRQHNGHDATARCPEVLLSRGEERYRDDKGSTAGRAKSVTHVRFRWPQTPRSTLTSNVGTTARTADWCGLTRSRAPKQDGIKRDDHAKGLCET